MTTFIPELGPVNRLVRQFSHTIVVQLKTKVKIVPSNYYLQRCILRHRMLTKLTQYFIVIRTF